MNANLGKGQQYPGEAGVQEGRWGTWRRQTNGLNVGSEGEGGGMVVLVWLGRIMEGPGAGALNCAC